MLADTAFSVPKFSDSHLDSPQPKTGKPFQTFLVSLLVARSRTSIFIVQASQFAISFSKSFVEFGDQTGAQTNCPFCPQRPRGSVVSTFTSVPSGRTHMHLVPPPGLPEVSK